MSNVVLECQALSKDYRQGPETLSVLAGVNLQLVAGERISIIGASGSGKTTLLNLLAGLDDPSSGAVMIKQQNFTQMSDKDKTRLRNHQMGFVYQFHHLLAEFTALENVALPLLLRSNVSAKEAAQAAKKLLTQVGLAERCEHKPSELSGGERQRVAIARALVTQPAIVLLDEPTGNLDEHTAAQINALIQELSETLATAFIMVTHDLVLARQMDKVYRLSEGLLLED